MLQLSWQVVDTSDWRVLSSWNFYFQWPANPQRVEPRNIDVNGLTRERLFEQTGASPLPLLSAMHVFLQDLQGCAWLVGHNVGFDLGFVMAAARALDRKHRTSWATAIGSFFPQRCDCT